MAIIKRLKTKILIFYTNNKIYVNTINLIIQIPSNYFRDNTFSMHIYKILCEM